MPDAYLDNLSIAQRTERWQDILNSPNPISKTFVADFNNQIVGFASAGYCRDKDMPKDTGEVLAIYVDQDTMGKGVGTALLKRCSEYLKELGCKRAMLWVLTSNDKTRKWYEARGWKVEGKTKKDIIHGIETHDTRYITEL